MLKLIRVNNQNKGAVESKDDGHTWNIGHCTSQFPQLYCTVVKIKV